MKTQVITNFTADDTALLAEEITKAQKDGGICAVIDTKNIITPTFGADQGVNMDDVLVSKPASSEEAWRIVSTLLRSDAVDIIAITENQ